MGARVNPPSHPAHAAWHAVSPPPTPGFERTNLKKQYTQKDFIQNAQKMRPCCPKLLKMSTSACLILPTNTCAGRHLNSVFIHYKRWIISVYVSTPTYSRRKHANSSSTCCMHPKHVCMNACAHARPDRFGQCFWPSRLSRCMKACMRLDIYISY